MQTFISILRGINVSGQKKIQMTDIKTLYEELKFKEVTTYIQSGNIIFKTNKKASDQSLSKKIEQAIYKKYNFSVPVIIRTVEEMKTVISVNPFIKESNIDTEKLHITFLAESPKQANVEGIKNLDYSPDKFFIIDKEVYLYCPNGYGITKLSNNFFENKLKVTATTRNWKTVNKLVTLATDTI
jgi:uncharacterized protein (DUF1697 family)